MAKTPTDEVTLPAPPTAKRKKMPQRGNRKRVLGKGEGDFCVMQISKTNDFPKGTLLPIPECPRFQTRVEAMRWIKNDSGDMLAGKTVMVFHACELVDIQVQTKPTVIIDCRPKIDVPSETAEAVDD